MELDDSQISEFEEKGFLLFPNLLNSGEVAILQDSVPEILNRRGPEVIREKDDPSVPRLAFGAHVYSKPFKCLSTLDRLLSPVSRLLGDEIYLHQSRMNPKPGFGGGGAWDWHQDFPPWHIIDGMAEPRCIMVSVFIDDCTAVTSPLLVVPGSQRYGLLESKLHEDAKGRGYELHHIDSKILEQLAKEHGIEPLIGQAGSVAFVHCNVVHGSANNISPWRRAIIYMNHNAVRTRAPAPSVPGIRTTGISRHFSPSTTTV